MTNDGIARGSNTMRHNPLAQPLSKQPRFGFCNAVDESLDKTDIERITEG